MKLSRIKELLKDAQVLNYPRNGGNTDIRNVTIDSRRAKQGSVFVALSGTAVNGEDYVEDAVQRGVSAVISTAKHDVNVPLWVCKDTHVALAAICSELYGHPEKKIKLVGITGTNGKTTTAYLLKSILEASGKRTGLIGTIKYEIGERIIPGDMTTPSTIEIYDYLSQMVGAGLEWCIMEVSSHGLAQRRTEGFNFDAAVFTNLSQDHLDYHKNMEDYFLAKSLLFKGLSKDSRAVINARSEYYGRLKEMTAAPVYSYGIGSDCDVCARVLDMTLSGAKFVLSHAGKEFEIESPLLGEYNVNNVLAAAAVALSLGMDLESIKNGISLMDGVPGRVESIDCGQDFAIIVDYAHTDDALAKLLSTVRPLTKNRLIVVFGCGGDRDKMKRPKMGRAASEYADKLFVTSDNPRTEDPQQIINMIVEGVDKNKPCETYVERYEAIKMALNDAVGGDVVVIAGKGHETYQRFADHVKFFDDRVVVREILEKQGVCKKI